jgi:translation initiation factor 1
MKKRRIVYSTKPDFNYGYGEAPEVKTPARGEQNLRVWLDRKKGGKVATIIKDFVGSEDSMKALSKELKTLCGVGGTAKNEEILIQGDHREKIMAHLKKEGYGAKKAGG